MNQCQVEARVRTQEGVPHLKREVISGTDQIIWRKNPVFITGTRIVRGFLVCLRVGTNSWPNSRAALANRFFCDDRFYAVGHSWLLSSWHKPSETEELNFNFCLHWINWNLSLHDHMWLASPIAHSRGWPMRVSRCLGGSYVVVGPNPPPWNALGDGENGHEAGESKPNVGGSKTCLCYSGAAYFLSTPIPWILAYIWWGPLENPMCLIWPQEIHSKECVYSLTWVLKGEQCILGF